MTDELRLALDPVADAFDAVGVRYRIGGSVASSALGVARSSIDVDLVADLRIEHVRPLVRRLEAAYYADESMMLDAIRLKDSFNFIHLETMMKIDVFILKGRPFDRAAFARVIHEPIGADTDRVFPITSAEDVVLYKLEWYRLGGGASQRQWEDILGVLELQAGVLDRAYLGRWAKEIEVTDLLERALSAAGLA